MEDRLKELGKRYGGNFAGSGLADMPRIANPNQQQRVYFDAQTNQHYVTDARGAFKPVQAQKTGQSFLQKAGAVGSQALNVAGDVLATGGRYIANTAVDVAQAAGGAVQTLTDTITQPMAIRAQQRINSQLDLVQDKLQQAYKNGTVSKQEFASKMREIANARMRSSEQLIDPILSGPTPQKRASDIVETAANVLTLGRYKPIQAIVTKGATKSAAIEGALNAVAQRTENVLKTVPAFRDLVARNSKYFAGLEAKQLMGETASQFLTRKSKDIAIGMLLKRPILYQSNIGLAQDAYNSILEGDYNQAVKDAAWMGAQAIGGGPLGWAARNAKKLTGKIRSLSSGKGSFIDELSRQIGTGSPAQIFRHLRVLKERAPTEYAKAEKALRIAQEVNLQATDDSVPRAVEAVTTHYRQHGIDLATITPAQLVEDLSRWGQADEIARKLSPKDSPVEYVAVRWDAATKNALAKRIQEAGDDLKTMVAAMNEMASQPGVGWGNNQILMSKIGKIIVESPSAAEAARGIREIPTATVAAEGLSKTMVNRLAKLGYTLATPWGGRKTPKVDYADTRKLITAASKGDDVFDEAIAPQPQLAGLASMLRRIGLSPQANTQVAYDKLSAALVSNLEELNMGKDLGLIGDDPARGAKYIMYRLQEYINEQGPNPYLNVGTLGRGKQSALQDIRQLNTEEIRKALAGRDGEGRIISMISKEQAKALQKTITKAYTDVPMEFRGLGVKAADYAYKVPGARAYYRIQSALRYTYNPFFRAQEVVETKLLSRLKANNLVWMKPKAELNRVAKLIDDSQIFTTGYTGEATQDLTVGRIHANLLDTQRRDLAGLAMDIAEKRGVTVEDMIRDHPEELADALRVIVQYPTKGVLNSPLARTLNIAFFPMRYNLKVAGIVAKEVAKLPPTVQTAFIHSMFKFGDWLKSPEGLQWQSDNADAIQVFSYFTPTQNVASVLNLLRDGKVSSPAELGLLGGLPFGALSQILDAQGLIQLNTPYMNPRTGDVLPDYIPQTTKARAATALEGLLNSMFSYPGRVIGLPGKGQFLREQIDLFLKTGNDEYLKQIRTEDLTPLQKKWIQVLGNKNVTQDQIDELYTSPAPGQFNWYTLPPMHLPEPKKVLTEAEVQAARAARRSAPRGKKKALPIPGPGQQL